MPPYSFCQWAAWRRASSITQVPTSWISPLFSSSFINSKGEASCISGVLKRKRDSHSTICLDLASKIGWKYNSNPLKLLWILFVNASWRLLIRLWRCEIFSENSIIRLWFCSFANSSECSKLLKSVLESLPSCG